MKKIVFLVNLFLGLALFCSCEETPGPYPEVKEYQGYLVANMPELPAHGGSIDIELSSPLEEAVIPIVVLTSSKPILSQPASWQSYENSELVLFPERVFRDAGYDNYPNDINFGYSYCWATISTYKVPSTNKGVMRIVYDENPEAADRKIYVHFNGFYNETVEVCQKGKRVE